MLKCCWSVTLLLLVLYQLDIIRRNALEHSYALLDELQYLIADISLNDDFILTLRILRYGRACREFGSKLLGCLLEIDVESFQAVDGRDKLALVSFDSFDRYLQQ